MSDNVTQFLSQIASLGLLNNDDLRVLTTEFTSGPLPNDCKGLIEHLVASGHLTEFQASLLSVGRGSDLRIGSYVILEKLGEGGMGSVFKAVHELMRRTVAIKTIRRTIVDSCAIERFQQEIEALGRLNHRNVVRAEHAGEAKGTWFLVMEFVPGADLAEIAQRLGPLRTADACEVVRQTALGLQYIHECGLIHRDIKPSNLMLTADGTVRILDLGLARFQSSELNDRRLTAAGQILGTVDYMAPEQAAGATEVDIRADIYSLGCLLFRLLTGHPPYHGPHYRGKLERVLAHINDRFPEIQKQRLDLPEPLISLLQKMVEKSPYCRFQRPADVEKALRAFCNDAKLSTLLELKLGSPIAKCSDQMPGTTVDVSIASQTLSRRPEPGSFVSRFAYKQIAVSILAAVGLICTGLLISRIRSDVTAPKGDTFESFQSSVTPLETGKEAERPLSGNPNLLGDGIRSSATTPATREPLDDIVERLKSVGARVTSRESNYTIDVRNSAHFTDEHIRLVVQCPNVVDLTMEHVEISDEGLKWLRSLTQLTRLILNENSITGTGIEELADSPISETLVSLGLRRTSISDKDVHFLLQFSRLDRLDLSETAITDESLETLKKLPCRVLRLTRTQISAAAVNELKSQVLQRVIDY